MEEIEEAGKAGGILTARSPERRMGCDANLKNVAKIWLASKVRAQPQSPPCTGQGDKGAGAVILPHVRAVRLGLMGAFLLCRTGRSSLTYHTA